MNADEILSTIGAVFLSGVLVFCLLAIVVEQARFWKYQGRIFKVLEQVQLPCDPDFVMQHYSEWICHCYSVNKAPNHPQRRYINHMPHQVAFDLAEMARANRLERLCDRRDEHEEPGI